MSHQEPSNLIRNCKRCVCLASVTKHLNLEEAFGRI